MTSWRPDRWLVLSARAPADHLRELLGEGLIALGGVAVEEKGDLLTTYLHPPEDPERFLADAELFLADWLMEDLAPELLWHWQDNREWEREWKRGLQPRQVTERLVVKPSWTEWEPKPGQVVIEIDPEMAFGTGEHATTRGCLRLLDGVIRPGDRVLDVGSGSAVLSIAAAHLGASEVVAIECDPDANVNARDNLRHNRAEERVRLIEAAAQPEMLANLGAFDLVLANILSGVIRPLLPAFARALALSANGHLVVSGILEHEAEAVAYDAEAAGFRVDQVDRENDVEGVWWSALLERR